MTGKDKHMPAEAISFLGLTQVRERTSLSKTTIYRLIGEEKFPRPYQLTERRVAWREVEVATWIVNRGVS